MKSRLWLLFLVITALLIFPSSFIQAATGMPQPLPVSFYGTVTVNGSPAPAGTVIKALDSGASPKVRVNVPGNPFTTSINGNYGAQVNTDAAMYVQGELTEGIVVTFYVNGVSTGKTYTLKSTDFGENININLSATITAPPTGGGGGEAPPTTTPPPTTTVPPTTTPAQTTPIASPIGSQPSPTGSATPTSTTTPTTSLGNTVTPPPTSSVAPLPPPTSTSPASSTTQVTTPASNTVTNTATAPASGNKPTPPSNSWYLYAIAGAAAVIIVLFIFLVIIPRRRK